MSFKSLDWCIQNHGHREVQPHPHPLQKKQQKIIARFLFNVWTFRNMITVTVRFGLKPAPPKKNPDFFSTSEPFGTKLTALVHACWSHVRVAVAVYSRLLSLYIQDKSQKKDLISQQNACVSSIIWITETSRQYLKCRCSEAMQTKWAYGGFFFFCNWSPNGGNPAA